MAGAAIAGLTGAVEAFGAAVIAAAQDALADADVRDVEIAGVPVRLRSALPNLQASLAHHRPTERAPAFELLVLGDPIAGGPPPRPPWGRGDYLPGDAVAGVDQDSRMQAAYNLEYGVLSVFDRDAGVGVWWARAPDRLPRWELSRPLKALLHWGLADAGRSFMHAAGVGAHGRGALLIGAGGSGKSTTALAARVRGLAITGDDYCLLGPGPRAHALYSVAKLRTGGLARLPELNDVATKLPDGDWFVDVDVTPSLPVDALVLPRVVMSGRTRVLPASPNEAMRALAPSSAFQLPGAPSRAIATLADLARDVPAYWLELWNDPDGAVAALEALLAC